VDDVELISREELTEYLLAVFDIRHDLKVVRRILEEDDGEAAEDDA
jgi:hypothetical protein